MEDVNTIKKQSENKINKYLSKKCLLIYLMVFVLFFIIFYLLVRPVHADYAYHVFEIYFDDWLAGDFYAHNNLFRYCMDVCHGFELDLKISAAIILSVFVLIRFISFFVFQNNDSILKKAFLSLTLCIIMTIDFGSLSNTYVGTFVGNIWHSPTYIAMLAFAPACIFLFTEIFIKDVQNQKNYIMLSIFIFLCCLSKPSFIIAYIPACAIFILINYFFFHKNPKKLLFDISKGIIICIPTFIFLIIAYITTFGVGGGENYIFFDFLGVWSIFSGTKINILINIIRSFILSLILLFTNSKIYNKQKIYYLLFLVISLIYFSFFAETVKYSAGNFAWTYASCGLMFNSFLLIDYFNDKKQEENKLFRVFVIIFVILQCFTSIRYICALINDIIHF